ncbi:MAG: deoxynucleoside kinase [candidate division WOR-3 bacterium]|nr:MAG: deoxynucleoside kinase [candidate division WOR-3 bacterium]
MRELRFIAIEGVIGAGKTSLTKVLANKMHAGTIFEEFEENPFLAKFYTDRRKYAFHTQIYFLMSRYRKQREMAQIDLFNSRLITDYLFVKDRIFAEVNLSEEEFALYDKIYSILSVDIPRPDLVIYLQADPELLFKRIRQRGRAYERDIDFEYIERLSEAYNTFFFHYNSSPMLIVNIKSFDFLANPRDLDLLHDEIKNLKEPRRVLSRA